MDISYCTLWLNIQCDLQCSLVIYHSIQPLTWRFHFYWLFYIYKKNVKRGRGKRYRQKLINSKHKGKHKIVCYPKYLLILNEYQVTGWWTIILGPVKAQPHVINVTEILLKISWHTHLNYSKTYIFILQKVKNPPDGFFFHIFFALSIILIFCGLFLHRLFSILKSNINWIRETTSDFSKQKFITRRENPSSINISCKLRKKPPKGHTKIDPLFSKKIQWIGYDTYSLQ